MNSLWTLEFFFLTLLSLQLLSFTKLSSKAFIAASALGLFISVNLPFQVFEGSVSLFHFQYDGLRQLFACMISGLGLVVGLYSHFYFGPKRDAHFFGLLGIFQWSCLLAVFADHTMMLATAWELTSITSFFLIGFHRQKMESQKAAIQAFVITGVGGLFLFAGLILLSEFAGSYSLFEIVSRTNFSELPHSYLICSFIMLGILTKSAQFPFHFWLPGAMQAPTPVSAYLHSATLVKLGVFLAAALWPMMKTFPLWHIGLSGLGLLSFAGGAFFSIFQRDLKAGLAYTTFSQLGLALMLFSQRSEKAFLAGCLVVIAHALYKSTLFLSVGIIAKMKNSQSLLELSGLGKVSRQLWLIVALAGGSMMGAIPFLGFQAKEFALAILVAGRFANHRAEIFSWVCFAIGSVFTIIFALFFIWKVFAGKADKTETSEAPRLLLFCLYPAAIASLLFGIYVSPLRSFFERIPLLPLESLQIPLHHGLNQEFIISMSLLTLGLIAGVFLLKNKTFWSIDWVKKLKPVSLAIAFSLVSFELLPKNLQKFNKTFVKLCSRYALPSICIIFLALSFNVVASNFELNTEILSRAHLLFCVLLISCGVLSIILFFLHSLPIQFFLLGAIGFMVAYAFALAAAPDLVLTQILIETASLVLLVLAWLSTKRKPIQPNTKIFPWVIAATFSALIVFAFSFLPAASFSKLSSLFFAENGVEYAYGNNLVNVVIVDFRALDTLGEITVLALSYLGALGFASRFKNLAREIGTYPAITDWMKQIGFLMLPILVLFSLFYLFRGHNLPGGGFIGGLLLALALFTRMILFAKNPFAIKLTFFGLSLSYASSLLPLFLGREFFESFDSLVGPSSMLFDIGVYLCVAGSISGLLEILMKFRKASWRHLGGQDA